MVCLNTHPHTPTYTLPRCTCLELYKNIVCVGGCCVCVGRGAVVIYLFLSLRQNCYRSLEELLSLSAGSNLVSHFWVLKEIIFKDAQLL